MRSIRRSLTVYLFGLLAVTLAVVWVVIDQVTARALAAQEAAGGDLIRARYDERCRDEKTRTDQVLLDHARFLGNLMQQYYPPLLANEFVKYQGLAESVHTLTQTFTQTSLFPVHFASLDVLARRGPVPSLLSRAYFSNLPLPEEAIRRFDEDSPETDYFQINTVSGREWRSGSLSARKLPFDVKHPDGRAADAPKSSEAPNLIDWSFRDATLTPDGEPVRRVLYTATLYSSRGAPGPRFGPPGFGGPGPPRSMLGTWGWAVGTFGTPPPTPGQSLPNLDALPRLYIQCARPQAAINAVLARFAAERDDELAKLSGEIGDARTRLRLQVAAVGLGAFLAIALGGPFLVGRGLRPVGKLSDAVSRVSEKDFRLPHDGHDLAVELAPIHARLTQTLDLLRRAFSREKQAVADISHELRTPIAALQATIDVSLRKTRTPEQYRATLEECRVITKQLNELVERIMTLASLDAGNDRTLLARTDAADLAAGCAAVIRPLAAANGITVDVRVEEPLELDTDPGKLREVLMNLLHNAVEYNKPGGSIELSARRDGDAVAFEVRDTGIGMAAGVREKIFERFYRADDSRHATGVHAGLGLAIVKEYVARLGGAIAVESTPGEGSTFRVTLPAPPADPAPPAARPAGAPVPAGTT